MSQHPTHAEATPPFPQQEQEPPGREADNGRLVFLATEDSRYISGEVIGATGGKPLH